MFELGWDKFFDIIVLADVEEGIQRQRVMLRDNISAEDFEKINRLQMPREEKMKRVDFVINTGGSKNALRRSVLALLKEL